MKKIILTLIISISFCLNSVASENTETTKDCFKKLNRGVFAFNQGLDNAIFKPLARGYRTLPSPIRTGVGNSLNNLSNLKTIPNNILQGEIKLAGQNTLRLHYYFYSLVQISLYYNLSYPPPFQFQKLIAMKVFLAKT